MKTGGGVDLPILPELAAELAHLPTDRMLFITQDGRAVGYQPETLGNWFRDRSQVAGIPGSLHGLRKAGATRLANAGANQPEIADYLGHKNTLLADIYTAKRNRARLGDSAFAKLSNVSNLSEALDKKAGKADDQQPLAKESGSP